MESALVQLGVGGIFALMVLKEVFGFLTRKRNGNPWGNVSSDTVRRLLDQIRELHTLHDQKDDDGVPVWYVRKSLGMAVEKLHKSIDTQTKVMEGLVREVLAMGGKK